MELMRSTLAAALTAALCSAASAETTTFQKADFTGTATDKTLEIQDGSIESAVLLSVGGGTLSFKVKDFRNKLS